MAADALSRMEMNALLTGMPDFPAMARAQQEDPQVRELQSSPPPSLTLQAIPLVMADITILCDLSTGNSRPIVHFSW